MLKKDRACDKGYFPHHWWSNCSKTNCNNNKDGSETSLHCKRENKFCRTYEEAGLIRLQNQRQTGANNRCSTIEGNQRREIEGALLLTIQINELK